MSIAQCIRDGFFYLDGGMGTSLQRLGLRPGELPEMWNLRRPEKITALDRAYYEAGSHAVCANTFGANGLKYDGKDGRPTAAEVIRAAVACAAEARRTARGGRAEKFIALDVGPLGRLLEPLGDLPFERAVSLFSEMVRAGAEAGADLVLIETMNDSLETKAAVLAARESCDLPVFASNVYDGSGKLMTGASPEAMVAMLEGLGVDALGVNCSLGPEQMRTLLPRFIACASVPVLVKPNAGMPREEHGETVYDVDAASFAATMREIAGGGARVLGGCCGTTPEYIRALSDATQGMRPLPLTPKHRACVSSGTRVVVFGEEPVLIGERINPTGKKRFKEALRAGDVNYILREGLAQQEKGARILDVNVGLPEIDEPAMLERCVRELQSVCDLPLQLDTSSPAAMERALRIYNGKPMINSVSGREESMDAIFPLARKYGGVTVCLTLDEHGIPETPEGRLAVARRIADRAAQEGIGMENLIFDPLAMTVASDRQAAQVTLDTIPLLRKKLGARCSLGVSNVSFGLPEREIVTASFFTMALARGLDAAIMNPYSGEMQRAYHAARALLGLDADCREYIEFAGSLSPRESGTSALPAPYAAAQPAGEGLRGAIIRGLREEAGRLAAQALEEQDPMTVIDGQIVPALDVVGKGYEEKTVFLPQLLMSAEAAKAAFEEVRRAIPAGAAEGPTVVLATVRGDIHDIGKNIVRALLENYGYRVVDLGRDVPPQTVAEAALRENARLVGLSALMTTTVPAMAETIALLREKKPDCRVAVGGAVLTQAYADRIGADRYARDAMETVRYAGEVFGRDCSGKV